MITRKKQLNSINITRIFQTSNNFNEHQFTTMINSSATKNLIFQKLINEKKFII